MIDYNFVRDYFKELKSLIDRNDIINKVIQIKKLLINQKKLKKKVLIFGNGGSAAISSHFSVDLTKNAKIRCVNFNEADLITCFSNDYGFENWIGKALDYYADPGDLLVLISSSGRSKNMLNACKVAKKIKIKKIITLTGHAKNNPLSMKSDINLWVNSKSYNLIENVHLFWLLCIIDLIIGKKNYSSKL